MKINERLRARHSPDAANTTPGHEQVPLLLPRQTAPVPGGESHARNALLTVGATTAATATDGPAGGHNLTKHRLWRHEQDRHQDRHHLRDRITIRNTNTFGLSHASSASSSPPPPSLGPGNQQQARPQPPPPHLLSLFSEDVSADDNEGVGIRDGSASSSAGLLVEHGGNGAFKSNMGQRWGAYSTPSTMRHWPDIDRGRNGTRRVSGLENLPSENGPQEEFQYFTAPHGQHWSTTPRSASGDADQGYRRESMMKGPGPVFGERGETRGEVTAPPPPVVVDDGLERRSSCGSLDHVKKRLWGSMFEGLCVFVHQGMDLNLNIIPPCCCVEYPWANIHPWTRISGHLAVGGSCDILAKFTHIPAHCINDIRIFSYSAV